MRHLIYLMLPLTLACLKRGHVQQAPQPGPDHVVGHELSTAVEPLALDGPNLDFAALAELMRKRNPHLREAGAAIRAADGRARQAGLIPNPVAEVEVDDYDVGEAGYDGAETTLRLKQPIPWNPLRRNAVAVSRAEVEVLRRAYERIELDLLGQLREAYDELQYLRQSMALNEELTSFTRQSLEIAKARFELRAAPQSDVSRAEVEVFEQELDRLGLERRQAQVMARLAELVALPDLKPARIHSGLASGERVNAADALENWLLAEHPALLEAHAKARVARLKLELARSERLPELSVMVGYSHNRADSNNTAEAALGIELPLFERNQGSIAEAEAEIEAAGSRIAALENRLRSELMDILADLEASRERRKYHADRVLPSARDAFEQVREGYEAGKLPFLDLIDAQRSLVAARLQQLELAYHVRQAESRLITLAGPALTHFQIETHFTAGGINP